VTLPGGTEFAEPERYRPPDSPEGEKEAILAALSDTGGARSQAAALLGMGRTTLWRKMKEYGIEVGEDGPDP